MRIQARNGYLAAKIPTFNVIPNNGNPYQVAAQAQLTSQANGGKMGIFWKVNRALNFCADDTDIIGSWSCQDQKKDQQYPPEMKPLAIVDDLQTKHLLFPGTSLHDVTEWGNGSSGHLVAWTSSGSGPGSLFSVRASVDLSAHVQNEKVMRSFLCEMHAKPVEWVLSQAHPIQTLKQWTPCFQGTIYDGTGTPAAANVSERIEWLLNSMMMVGGGANNLLSTPPAGQETQGCLGKRTSVPWPVIAIFGVVTLILVFLTLYLLFLLASLQRWGPEERKKFRDAPDDLLSWMAQAAREVGFRTQDEDVEQNVKSKVLVEWDYAAKRDGRPAGVRKKAPEDAESAIVMVHGASQHQAQNNQTKPTAEIGVQEVSSRHTYQPYQRDVESSTSLLVR
jgi:hypothetical protein